MSRQPNREFVPPVARYRLQYAKRGRLRFASHRDFQRSFERALRRAGVPMAYSAGFSPHPKISYANAAPTGAASEAEYVEIGVMAHYQPQQLRDALNAALPAGFDIVDLVPAHSADLISRLEASQWQISLPHTPLTQLQRAVAEFLAATSVEVERMTKKGMRKFDVRNAVVSLAAAEDETGCAILHLVVRHGTPSVRPDDVLTGLNVIADLQPAAPPVLHRLAQGPLRSDESGVGDPLEPDRLVVAAEG